jgi:hypothetical protein
MHPLSSLPGGPWISASTPSQRQIKSPNKLGEEGVDLALTCLAAPQLSRKVITQGVDFL